MTPQEELALVRAAWLNVIQDENFCPPTGRPCGHKRCACLEEQALIIREYAQAVAQTPKGTTPDELPRL